MTEIITLLKEFGFPAVAFGMMFFLCVKTLNSNTKAISKLEKTLYQFMIEFFYKKSDEKCPDSGKQS